MAKLTRITGKLFGETATATGDNPQIGQFGSGLAGTYVGTTDVATIQNLTAWSNGFIGCVTPDTQYPPLPEMTGFGKVLSYQQNYLLQQGIAEWDNATTYYINSYVSYNGKIYISLTDNNLNHNPATSTANWAIYGNDIYTNIDLSNLSATGQAILDNKANISLSNLSTLGNNRLHALKGYLDNGTALTDSEGLADVIKYAHSTFDVSKFTVTGTPTITDDGIASGLGVNNAIYLDTNIIIGQKPFKIKAKVNYPDTSTGKRIFQCSASASNTSGLTFFVYTQVYGSNPSGLRMAVYLSDGTNISEGISNISGDVVVEFEFTGSQYILRAFNINNELLGEKALASNLYPIDIDTHHLRIGTNATDVTYDLKYFDVDIDGVPVFSGNKIGTDTYTIGGNTVSVPYTLSKTGSKIVDSLYRTEVQAVYDQYGYAPYYTLSDTDFTLPMGELYGMINRLQENSNREIGVPIPTFSTVLKDDEIWLEGASVLKIDYPRLYAVYGDIYEDSNNPTDSNHFRLPNCTDRVMQGINSTGTFGYIAPGLPNITGNIVNNPIFANAEDNSNGAFRTTNLSVALIGGGDGWQAKSISFDASRSSGIYGNSNTVQAPAIKVRVKTRYK